MANLGFTYLFTNNMSETKKFYSEILALELIWDEEDDIAFNINNHQLSIQYHKDFKKASPLFSIQPGWKGGVAPRTSWSIAFESNEYNQVIARLQKESVKTYHSVPQWVGYWSFPVLDPMNNTIEITCSEYEING